MCEGCSRPEDRHSSVLVLRSKHEEITLGVVVTWDEICVSTVVVVVQKGQITNEGAKRWWWWWMMVGMNICIAAAAHIDMLWLLQLTGSVNSWSMSNLT